MKIKKMTMLLAIVLMFSAVIIVSLKLDARECDICYPIPSFDCYAGTLEKYEFVSSVCDGWTSTMCRADYLFWCNYDGRISQNTVSAFSDGCCSVGGSDDTSDTGFDDVPGDYGIWHDPNAK